MRIRLGDVMVQMGLLTAAQRDEVVRVQGGCGRPFGLLAEQMFGIGASEVEAAWATQYAHSADRCDPRDEVFEPRALARVERRQAWQFRCLPMRYEGEAMVVCTTGDHLLRSLRFTGWRISEPCIFVLTTPEALGMALMGYYPMSGMSPELLSVRPEYAVKLSAFCEDDDEHRAA